MRTQLKEITRNMKTSALLVLITTACIAWTSPASAQDPTGTVYLLRNTGRSGSVDGYSIFMDGQRICVLNNMRYSKHEVPVGEHRFTIRFDGTNESAKATPLTVAVKAGMEYYVWVQQRGGLITKVDLQELAEGSGKTSLAELTEDPNCQ